MTIEGPFSANDRALIAEAVRRIERSPRRSPCDRAAIVGAVSAALLDGRRDLFGLVKAGSQVGATNPAQ